MPILNTGAIHLVAGISMFKMTQPNPSSKLPLFQAAMQRQSCRLSREEVRAKYGPVADPAWTPEVEAAFFAGLPRSLPRHATTADSKRAMLVREFGAGELKAKRMGAAYVSTLGAILGDFYEADMNSTECLVAQRNERLGPANTIRTIQVQMLRAGRLVKQTRPQGHGFVGAVFVYAPVPLYRHRVASTFALEMAYRASEGESAYPLPPSNLPKEAVPF